jgi:predicted DCC family thiol-disulfide oxidoreductase YuxK
MRTAHVLFYRGTCPRCRLLSRIVTLLSLGQVKRLPIGSSEAQRLYELYPESRGKLALIVLGRVYVGAELLRGAWRAFSHAVFGWRSSAP